MIRVKGHYRNQAVELSDPIDLPEGTEVELELTPIGIQAAWTSLSEGLLALAGQAQDLPDDMAQNHDHYLHGKPRR